jgi:hypothetical protein
MRKYKVKSVHFFRTERKASAFMHEVFAFGNGAYMEEVGELYQVKVLVWV